MKLSPENLYHIYNRGNNQRNIFPEKRNYIFFLNKIKNHITKFSDIICYCLIPNHFHLLVQINSLHTENELNKEIGVLLRSYTRAINLQEESSGSLFQQKTKAKNVNSHFFVCFNYIHQNPLKAGLSDKIKDWEYSSFNEYTGKIKEPISKIELGKRLIDFKDQNEFYKYSYQNIDTEKRKELFQ